MIKHFKNLVIVAVCCFATTVINAQAGSWPKLDKSILDMTYFPSNYALNKLDDKKPAEQLLVRVLYSRPLKNNRTIFGSDIVPYGKVWRLGANEATELQLFAPAKIGGKTLPAGRYTLYALVNENDWTFIVNKETDTWGAYKYDIAKDIVRVTVPTVKLDTSVEALSCKIDKTGTGANLIFAWDNVSAALPIAF